jgi:hypothetical protein
MTCLGVLDRGERGDDNGTGLKEGEGVKLLTTVLHYAMLALFALYLPKQKYECSLYGRSINVELLWTRQSTRCCQSYFWKCLGR